MGVPHGTHWQDFDDRVGDKGAIKSVKIFRCDRGFREGEVKHPGNLYDLLARDTWKEARFSRRGTDMSFPEKEYIGDTPLGNLATLVGKKGVKESLPSSPVENKDVFQVGGRLEPHQGRTGESLEGGQGQLDPGTLRDTYSLQGLPGCLKGCLLCTLIPIRDEVEPKAGLCIMRNLAQGMFQRYNCFLSGKREGKKAAPRSHAVQMVFYKGELPALIDPKRFKETFAKKKCPVFHLQLFSEQKDIL